MKTRQVGKASWGKRISQSLAIRLDFLVIALATILLLAATATSFGQCTRCGPLVSVKPLSLTFKPQLIRTKSAAQHITITNVTPGGARVTIVTTGPFQSSGCTGTLGAHRSCTLSVTFTPVALGAATGAVSIADGSAAGHFKVKLSGKGVASTAENFEEKRSPFESE